MAEASPDPARSASSVDRGETDDYRLLPVVLTVRDFLVLFEHVCFGLVVGNLCRLTIDA